MKVLIGGIRHETNTFSNVKTNEESFRLWGWDVGEEIHNRNEGVRSFIGGMIDRAQTLDIEIIPTFATYATPSGVITEQTYETMINLLVDQIKQSTDYDAVVLSLHGAGVAENTEDLEGSILREVRSVVGEDIPIIVTLDLHANMTTKMVEFADAILGNHLYPHSDSYDIGAEAVSVAKNIVEGKLKPTMYLEQLPMVISTSTSYLSPVKEINDFCYQWEEDVNVVDCTFYHGFPYTNISHLGVAVLVTTNNDMELAQKIAEEVGESVWSKKEEFIQKDPSPEEGIHLALAHEGRPVVLNETSDNPGAGTPGDGTFLLRAMIESNLVDACFGFIYDPEIVQSVMKAGVGASIDIELGGKTDSLHGEPLQINAYVKSITDGQFIQISDVGKGTNVNLGLSVRLQYNGVDIIVCSVKAQVLDEQIFLLHGIDIQKYKIVGLKSSQHFRARFQTISSRIITVDSPGLSTKDFTSFNYSNLTTNVFPLHDVSYNKKGEKIR